MSQAPSARVRHSGDPVDPNTLRCPTGRCWGWGLGLQSPSGHPYPPKKIHTHWQKHPRQPTAPAAHMHGLIGTGKPRAPAHAADAPVPEKGRRSAICQHCFLPASPPSSPQPPGSPQAAMGKRNPPHTPSQPLCSGGGVISPRPRSLCGLVTPGSPAAFSPRQDRRGGGQWGDPPSPKCLQNRPEPRGSPSPAAPHPQVPIPELPVCTNCPGCWVPSSHHWVPPDQVPPSH